MTKIIMHIQTNGATGVYILTYRAEKFYKLEHKRGKVSDEQFKSLMKVVPPTLTDLEEYRKLYERVIYEQPAAEPASLFKILLDKYHAWYIDKTGISPRIDGVTGNHLKQIITWLKTQSADEKEVELSFNLILDHWSNLPEFYQKQMELRQINSNLNIILNHVKNGKSDSKSTSATIADDFRKSL